MKSISTELAGHLAAGASAARGVWRDVVCAEPVPVEDEMQI